MRVLSSTVRNRISSRTKSLEWDQFTTCPVIRSSFGNQYSLAVPVSQQRPLARTSVLESPKGIPADHYPRPWMDLSIRHDGPEQGFETTFCEPKPRPTRCPRQNEGRSDRSRPAFDAIKEPQCHRGSACTPLRPTHCNRGADVFRSFARIVAALGLTNDPRQRKRNANQPPALMNHGQPATGENHHEHAHDSRRTNARDTAHVIWTLRFGLYYVRSSESAREKACVRTRTR